MSTVTGGAGHDGVLLDRGTRPSEVDGYLRTRWAMGRSPGGRIRGSGHQSRASVDRQTCRIRNGNATRTVPIVTIDPQRSQSVHVRHRPTARPSARTIAPSQADDLHRHAMGDGTVASTTRAHRRPLASNRSPTRTQCQGTAVHTHHPRHGRAIASSLAALLLVLAGGLSACSSDSSDGGDDARGRDGRLRRHLRGHDPPHGRRHPPHHRRQDQAARPSARAGPAVRTEPATWRTRS